jgi:putative MATE family efflux protein
MNSVLRNYLKYSMFNILGMLSISIYILADTYFIAQALGENGLAGLNIALSVYSIIHGSGLLIGVGCATKYQILKVSNKIEQAQQYYSLAIKTSFFIGIFFLVIGLLLSDKLSVLLGADEIIFPYANIYMKVMILGAPAYIFNQVFQAFIRNDNKANITMIAMICSAICNIILDYIFLFVFDMGMFGAAIATVGSTYLSILIMISIHYRKKFSYLFLIIKTKINFYQLKYSLPLGLSAFVIELSISVVLITFNLLLLNLQGNVALASYGIVANIALVVLAIFNGLAQATQPLASQYYALKQKNNLKLIKKYGLIFSFFISLIIYIFINLTSDVIISLFNSTNSLELKNITNNAFRIYFLGFFIFSINLTRATIFASTQKAKQAFMISILRGLIIIVPSAIIFSRFLGVNGVWISFIIAEAITLKISLFSTKKSNLLE